MDLVRAEQMRAMDRLAIERYGVPSLELMEAAGRGCAEGIATLVGDATNRDIHIVVGKGNNGGDGLVVARYLCEEGCRVTVHLAFPLAECSAEAEANGARLPEAVRVVSPPALGGLRGDEVLVDALLGVGLSGELREPLRSIVHAINQFPGLVIALDVPSGVGEDNGQVTSPAVSADHTLTIGFPKVGLFLEPATHLTGTIHTIPLPYPAEVLAAIPRTLAVLEPEQVAPIIPPRLPGGHKGTYGHLLIVGGSRGMPGSVALAAGGAFRSGVGSVVVATAASAQPIVAGFQRETMSVALPETPSGVIAPHALESLAPHLEWADALAVGPGMTREPAARAFLVRLLERWQGPLVLDADGLKLAARELLSFSHREIPAVCTPHPGEASVFLGVGIEALKSRPLDIALEAAQAHRLVLLLKGYRPLIASPTGRASVVTVGNPGLGTAGSGDVLTGVIGALLAQGVEPYAAACAGGWLHSAAGDRAAEKRGQIGMIASDVIDALPKTIHTVLRNQH